MKEKQNKKRKEKIHNAESGPTFDMYHLFSRWDFWLLVIFVLITLILTALMVFSGNQVA